MCKDPMMAFFTRIIHTTLNCELSAWKILHNLKTDGITGKKIKGAAVEAHFS